jgi:ABC-2 type transport system permease protein
MNFHVISAIFRRNFVSYFSNPTGYVFICVFVLASSFAAFWPSEFFNANLANLDQLNRFLPFVLLFFIPAITMGLWADERRQGTDELLLTIPAADFEVVLGKYLAAVAIYTVSLLFSLVSNFVVLSTLGIPDFGLICGTYFGYWIVGLAMIATGMVASFLTGNLTVSFVLGAVLNAPIVFAAYADVISSDSTVATFIKRWSVSEQFRDFSRGVISISSLGYFLGIVVLMLYLSMVLIGRRHWKGGLEGQGARVHYFVRFVALLAAVLGVNMVLARNDSLRIDVTTEQLSSLAPETRNILRNLDSKYPINIDAYISPTVPENYVQTRLNLLSALREFQAMGSDRITVNIHSTEAFSTEAQRAEQQFGIKPTMVVSSTRGARSQEEIFLGVAFTSGLEQVVVPFFDRGLPVEYELIRSIATVASPQRKKLGILTTDAKLYGGIDMQSMTPTQDELIIDELKKQYDLVQVDPSSPITERYDALLAVQPSSLSPEQMENFVACVRSGQPTAIFEDPFPLFNQQVPGTMAPRQPQGGMNPFMQQPPPGPKGDINRLWDLLGVDFNGSMVVWQDYNPYPKIRDFTKEWVFIGLGSGADEPFNEQDIITSGLQQLLFPYPGSMRGQNASSLKFTPLIMTSEDSGEVPADKIVERSMMGARINPQLSLLERMTNERYIIAARIGGKLKDNVKKMLADEPASGEPADAAAADETPPAEGEAASEPSAEEATADEPATEQDAPAEAAPAEANDDATSPPAAPAKDAVPTTPPPSDEISVVLVADIDCLYSAFFAVRARGMDEDDFANFDFDNVTFVLNTLDSLAGDKRFIDIRKRRFAHRTLSKLTEATATAREQADIARTQFNDEFEKAESEAQKNFREEIAKIEKRKSSNMMEVLQELEIAKEQGQRKLDTKVAQLTKKRDRELKQIDRDLALNVRQVQDWYKTAAVLLPPIPPLLVGLYVFFNRRAREREGVSKARLR